MFARRSRLTVIRLDLGYHAATFSSEEVEELYRQEPYLKGLDRDWYWSGETLCATEQGADRMKIRVALEEVQRDRKRLFTNMKGKPTLFEHLFSYVWRIECTPHAGYHVHLALFFLGDKIKKHEHHAQQIGEYWENNVTSGRGRFHNCNRAWERDAARCGIGEIESHDHVKRANLRNALAYLCKDAQAVLMMPYARCNLFGSGFAHKDHSKGRGRPRTVGEPKGGTGWPGSANRISSIVIPKT